MNRFVEILEKQRSIVEEQFWLTQVMEMSCLFMLIWYGKQRRMLIKFRFILIKLLKLPQTMGKKAVLYLVLVHWTFDIFGCIILDFWSLWLYYIGLLMYVVVVCSFCAWLCVCVFFLILFWLLEDPYITLFIKGCTYKFFNPWLFISFSR